MIKNSSATSFSADVLSVKERVLVYFWSDSADLCKTTWPILEDLVSRLDRVDIVKVNSDHNPSLLTDLGITTIPTVILFEDGKETKRTTEVFSKEAFIEEFGLN
jgi:thioredoxin 1